MLMGAIYIRSQQYTYGSSSLRIIRIAHADNLIDHSDHDIIYLSEQKKTDSPVMVLSYNGVIAEIR